VDGRHSGGAGWKEPIQNAARIFRIVHQEFRILRKGGVLLSACVNRSSNIANRRCTNGEGVKESSEQSALITGQSHLRCAMLRKTVSKALDSVALAIDRRSPRLLDVRTGCKRAGLANLQNSFNS
jgi:hypothetical protein